MPKRTAKRKTAEQIAAELMARRAQNLEAVGMQREAASLPQHDAVEVTRLAEERGPTHKKAAHDVARRMDAFEALKDGMQPGVYTALRRFEGDLLLRRGEADRGAPSERVDRTAGLVTDAMIDAGRRVDAITAQLEPRSWWLLMELLSPSREFGSWRGTVAFITGLGGDREQEAAVHDLGSEVLAAYDALTARRAA